MSDEALRDRIADIIERVGYDWDAQMMSAVVDGKPEPPQPLADTAAQAIIDEFGLTVSGDGCGYHEIYGSCDTRFGRWEANE